MLTLAIRNNSVTSSNRLARLLLLNSPIVPSQVRQYNPVVQPTLNQILVSTHSWRLTHQPRESNLRRSYRFQSQSENQFFDQEESSSADNWDLWFEHHQTSSIFPVSSELFFPDQTMPKRKRDSSIPSTSIEIPIQRGTSDYIQWKLPKRRWSCTDYEQRMDKSRHEHFQFHLITYNILAQRLIEENRGLYDDCADIHLDWDRRKERILKEILKIHSDIICLQEMQVNHYHEDFQPKMNKNGYDSIYIKRSGNKLDGCCIFYRTDKLKLVTSKAVPFYRRNIEVLDRDNCGLLGLFQPVSSKATSDDLFCVATTHLLFSPKRGDIKLAQLQYFLAEIDRFALKDPQLNIYHPIIICGDFNAQPQSPLSKFLLDGHIKYDGYRRIDISGQIPQSIAANRFSLPLPPSELIPSSFVTSECRFPAPISPDNHHQWILQNFQRRNSIAQLTHNKEFYSVYDLEDTKQVTTRIENESNLLDYIFYTRQSNDRYRLNLLSRYDLYHQNQMSNISMPNHQFPSDHFLLAAEFALKLRKKKKKS